MYPSYSWSLLVRIKEDYQEPRLQGQIHGQIWIYTWVHSNATSWASQVGSAQCYTVGPPTWDKAHRTWAEAVDIHVWHSKNDKGYYYYHLQGLTFEWFGYHFSSVRVQVWVIATLCPSEWRWHQHFSLSASGRMAGDMVTQEQDRAYTIDVLLAMIDMLEDRFQELGYGFPLREMEAIMFFILTCFVFLCLWDCMDWSWCFEVWPGLLWEDW